MQRGPRVAMSGGEQLQSGYIRHKTGHTHTHTEQCFFTYVSTYTHLHTGTLPKQNSIWNTHRRVMDPYHVSSFQFFVVFSHYRHFSFSLSYTHNNKLVASAHKTDCRIDTIINTITESFSPSYNSSLINTVINSVNKSHKHSETHSAQNKGLVTQELKG